jgi:hypothetical protein
MAYAKTDATVALKTADGFLNLTLVASDGTEHHVQKVVPLYKSKLLDRSLLNKAGVDATHTFTLKGSVHVSVDLDSAADIAL